ncbi:hypothetical protein KP509_21G050500 [Ceratopteris richardii]|nr:hypothetical protein KP509_21G050500 [Ceratopteris richardii]
MRMCENGLHVHPELGNLLVTVFVQCGCRCDALAVFNRLHKRNEFSWTALIEDSVDSMEFKEALGLYEQMIVDSVAYSRYTIVAALQACRGDNCVETGYEIHAQAEKLGFSASDVYLKSAMVDLYCKCGSMVDAEAVITKQSGWDAVSCTALMAGHVMQGAGYEALQCFEKMQDQGVTPRPATFVLSLRAGVLVGAQEKGQQLHSEIVKAGYDRNIFVGSSLVDLYSKYGLLPEAQAVFDYLPNPDVVCWTALIAGYSEHGFGEQALDCLERMEANGVYQNMVTFMFGLKACAVIGAVKRAQEMHSSLLKLGYDRDLVVANALVDTYANWGLLADAWLVFFNLPVKDLATFNSLMCGYSEHGLGEETLRLFHGLRAEGMFPDVITFVSCLGACGSIQSIDSGRELHIEIVKQGLETVLSVGSAVLDMYMKCQCSEEAWGTFCALPMKDDVLWTSLIEGYAEEEFYEEALECMEQMQQEGVPFSPFTYASGLKACKGIGLSSKGKELHAGIVKLGFEEEIVACNILLDMYASAGLFLEAEAVFQRMQFPDDISWNVLIGGYGEHGLDHNVLDCFQMMRQEGVRLNEASCVLALKACGNLTDIDYGRELHIEIIQERLERDPFVNSSLVDMYSNCGFLGDAFDVFSELPAQDVVSWTALISGLVKAGFNKKALNYLQHMQQVSVHPNSATFACALKACGDIRDLSTGQRLHYDIIKEEYEGDNFVAISLIDMYGKCSSIDHAQEVFNELPVKDVVAWTALLTGFVRHGLTVEALACFRQMKPFISPNAITFVCILKACSTLKAIECGREIHSDVFAKGLDANQAILNWLVHMYASCGLLEDAVYVFDELEVRGSSLWTLLMAGYAREGQMNMIPDLLERMLLECGYISKEDWAQILTVCNAVKTLDMCFKLHKATVERGYDTDFLVDNTLKSIYAYCTLAAGLVEKSETPSCLTAPEPALSAV